jgi:hypothetical protein
LIALREIKFHPQKGDHSFASILLLQKRSNDALNLKSINCN